MKDNQLQLELKTNDNVKDILIRTLELRGFSPQAIQHCLNSPMVKLAINKSDENDIKEFAIN
jgi:hypothetical protein